MSEKKAPGARTAKPAPTQPAQRDPQYITRLTVTLLAICVVVALLLGVTNAITKPLIDEAKAEKARAAMMAVFPADEYVPVERELPKGISAWYTVRHGGTSVGWVLETTAAGSQGPITMMVGVDINGEVTGVSVISHSETSNIGTKVVDSQTVLDRLIGMSHADGEITLNAGTNRFDGVSGATYSSKGVVAGVNAALDAVAPDVGKW